MKPRAVFLAYAALSWMSIGLSAAQPAKRLVILKVDGLNADLLARTMTETDSSTGKPLLRWMDYIFSNNGLIFEEFYTRGISLSAPSWSMLDTGNHVLIKNNVEYDRYTGRVYDYLNFFPFYLSYARLKEVDMPSVRVLDEASVSLLIDAFPYEQQYQSAQLFQRGVRWTTLRRGLQSRLTTKSLASFLEYPQGGVGLSEGLAYQTERELLQALADQKILYLDLFTGEFDHVGHSVNDLGMLRSELVKLDALVGRIWSAIETSPFANSTLFVMVSDHGMNNVPGIYSQTFAVTDLLNSPVGGAHHVITNRHQLSDYKIWGLDPLIDRVSNPSNASFYLQNQAEQYPTAWLDLDGNERASVSLRNSEINRIQILLEQLNRKDLSTSVRAAAAKYLRDLVNEQRPNWESTIRAMKEELSALTSAIAVREKEVEQQSKKRPESAHSLGLDKKARRASAELAQWIEERAQYSKYVFSLEALLALQVNETAAHDTKIPALIPPMSLGDRNTVFDLQHYVVGPSDRGMVLDMNGDLDEERSFRYVDYFPLFASQVVRNNPQKELSVHPVDFAIVDLPVDQVNATLAPSAHELSQAIWIYGDDEHQLIELISRSETDQQIRLIPVTNLAATSRVSLSWRSADWAANFPLRLYEDANLQVPPAVDRKAWLSEWHNERDWFDAIKHCRYSNGVIGISETLLPPRAALPPRITDSALGRLELRRRNLVQPDFQLFASDHWNFNVRNFNPGGNHGSFLRISTHSVWMMSGAGISEGKVVTEPYDSLNFASTLLNALGKPAPMPVRVVPGLGLDRTGNATADNSGQESPDHSSRVIGR
jgi:hypothetical protein